MSETPESAEIEPDVVYDLNSETAPSTAVVTAVARVTDRSPVEMKPLAEVVDPDALDAMIDRRSENEPSVTVSFEYCGFRVSVTPQGFELSRQA